MIRILTWGSVHGPLDPAFAPHLALDVTDLFRDPHIDPVMREMTGLDDAVYDNVMRQPGAKRTAVLLAEAVERCARSVDEVRVAINCVGGRHRSVALGRAMAQALDYLDVGQLELVHRDVDKPVKRRSEAGAPMATTITDDLMTSDQTPHTARWSQHAAADGRGAWIVSWLPLRLFTRDQAITAMTLAEVAATRDLSPEHDLWAHVEGWAGELGLTAEQAVRRLAAVA